MSLRNIQAEPGYHIDRGGQLQSEILRSVGYRHSGR